MSIINRRMRELRERDRYTIKEMSDKLGVSVATAQRYESDNGIKAIPYEIIEKAAKIFDVSPSYIMGWDQEMDDAPPPGHYDSEYILERNFTVHEPHTSEKKEEKEKDDPIVNDLVNRLYKMTPRQRMKVVDAIFTLLDYRIF